MKTLTLLFFMLGTLTGGNQALFDFGSGEPSTQWMVVNDNVMGGVSQGDFTIGEDGILYWKGAISLENNGGFASLRSPVEDYDFSAYQGLRLRIKADGRKYTLNLRTTRNWNAISYMADFKTKAGKWMEIEVPFSAFTGRYFGYEQDNIAALDPAKIKQVGVMLYDKQAGPFEVEMDWVGLY